MTGNSWGVTPSQSKEDQTQQISKSVFVTNFTDHFSAHDLWNVCNGYGKVIDVFIPFKRSKTAQRPIHHQPSKTYAKTTKTSFASILKKDTPKDGSSIPPYISSKPALVLDDSCLLEREFSTDLIGKFKDVTSIPNLPFILFKEGFPNVKITTKVHDTINERVKIIIHGKVHWIHAKELNTWEPEFDEENADSSSEDEFVDKEEKISSGKQQNIQVDVFKNKEEKVSESSCMHGDDLVYDSISKNQSEERSEDPFNIYDILKAKKEKDNQPKKDSLPFSHGFSPMNDGQHSATNAIKEQALEKTPHKNTNEVTDNDFVCNKGNHSHKINTGGSMLEVLDEMVKVGIAMGYNIDGGIKDMEAIIGSQGDHNVFR
ncbi:RNA-directed DNA polymerase, eukaryota, nucleotide-binding alpha-beta plait domain protein [Tanacetum coccineum]